MVFTIINPMYWANRCNPPRQVLLKFRADLDSPCRNGLTPLTGVASLANPETVKVGAQPAARGKSVLEMPAIHGFYMLLQVFSEYFYWHRWFLCFWTDFWGLRGRDGLNEMDKTRNKIIDSNIF